MKKVNFVFPESRNGGWGGFRFDQEHYTLLNCTFSDELKKLIFPEHNNKVTKSWRQRNINDEIFLTQAEKDILKIYKDYTTLLNVHQETYFLYDRTNLLKKSFYQRTKCLFINLLFV